MPIYSTNDVVNQMTHGGFQNSSMRRFISMKREFTHGDI
nr:MAG TPA: hypothetical protein [Caudoviricetes sp.]